MRRIELSFYLSACVSLLDLGLSWRICPRRRFDVFRGDDRNLIREERSSTTGCPFYIILGHKNSALLLGRFPQNFRMFEISPARLAVDRPVVTLQ